MGMVIFKEKMKEKNGSIGNQIYVWRRADIFCFLKAEDFKLLLYLDFERDEVALCGHAAMLQTGEH